MLHQQALVLHHQHPGVPGLLRRYEEKLLANGVCDSAELDEIKQRCAVEVTDAIEFAEKSPTPDPATVGERVYAV